MGFFSIYDESEFENKDLPKLIEGGERPFIDRLSQRNRFNSTLLSAILEKNTAYP